MFDTSTLGLIGLIIRVIGSILFATVLFYQIDLLRQGYKDGLDKTRVILTTVITAAFMFNFIAIYNNYVRFTDGIQNQTLNNYTFILGALVSTATAYAFFLLYRRK